MQLPKQYPGPDKLKAILAWAKITGVSKQVKWVEMFAEQSDEHQRLHYWQLRSVLIHYNGVQKGRE